MFYFKIVVYVGGSAVDVGGLGILGIKGGLDVLLPLVEFV